MSTTKEKPNPRIVTLSQLQKQMTAAQRGYLSTAVKARDDEQRITARVALATRVKVKEALEAGVSARVLANALGLSVPRIYQMRTEIENG